MDHTVIPATREAEIKRIAILGHPGGKVSKIPSQQTGCVSTHILIPGTWKTYVKGLQCEAGPREKHKTLSGKKKNESEKDWCSGSSGRVLDWQV
jgi:hypothetical protein